MPDATGTSILEYLPVRGGGSVTATLTSSNGTVGTLKTSAGSGSTAAVVIGTNQIFSLFGGVAFGPVGGGTTIVAATAPGLLSGPAVTVTVSAPDINLNAFAAPTVIGGGLQLPYRGRLAAPAPTGGLMVRVESSNGSLALVSADQLAVGRAFVNIPVAAGQTDFTYYTRGVQGAVGVFTITASTPGFTNSVRSGNVVQPAIKIESLPSTVAATQDTNVQFRVALGVPTVGNTDLQFTEEAAPGTSFVVTVTNSNGQAAQLFTAAGADQTRTILVPEGETGTRYGATQGGIEFDPLSGGASGLLTQVQASVPGFIGTTAATVFVTVTPN